MVGRFGFSDDISLTMDYAADDVTAIAARLKELATEREPKPLTWENALGSDLDEFAPRWGLNRFKGESDDDLRKRIHYMVYSGG